MRRLVTIAAFLLGLSLVPVYVCAQHGGGGHGGGFGGGGHAGFSGGGHSGFSGHSSFSSSAGFGASRFGSSSGSRYASGGSRYPSGAHSYGYYGNHYGYYGNRGPYYGYGYGRWPYFYSAYGYPYYGYDPWWDAWWWDNGPTSYDQDSMNQRQLAAEMNQQNLQEQDWLRQQNQNDQDQDAYARPSRQAQPAAEAQPQNDPATVLVFRDQQQREIHNYAIADGILYNFTASRTEKIPLAVIDIPATVKANDDRGVEFHLPPPPNEGQ
jgi:hypothetical protein